MVEVREEALLKAAGVDKLVLKGEILSQQEAGAGSARRWGGIYEEVGEAVCGDDTSASP